MVVRFNDGFAIEPGRSVRVSGRDEDAFEIEPPDEQEDA